MYEPFFGKNEFQTKNTMSYFVNLGGAILFKKVGIALFGSFMDLKIHRLYANSSGAKWGDVGILKEFIWNEKRYSLEPEFFFRFLTTKKLDLLLSNGFSFVINSKVTEKAFHNYEYYGLDYYWSKNTYYNHTNTGFLYQFYIQSVYKMPKFQLGLKIGGLKAILNKSLFLSFSLLVKYPIW